MAKGRRIGTKNFSVRSFTNSQLKSLLYNMNGAFNKGAARSLEEMTPQFLAYLAQTEPGFNDFTGNLANSYTAQLYVRRKYVKSFFHDTGRHGTVHHGPRGGRWVSLMPPARHKVRRKQLLPESERSAARHTHEWQNVGNTPEKRYLKKWENPNGYRKNTGLRGSSFSAASFGSAKAQNFVRFSNQAPYAEMVQQGKGGVHRHYRVLRGAAVSKMTSKATEIVKYVTLQELKKAGFKVK